MHPRAPRSSQASSSPRGAGRPAPGVRLPFPPRPRSFRGRERELALLTALVRHDHPTAIALVGGGGAGKSTLAAALGHRLRARFEGRIAWVRIGAWDARTVLEMMALGLGHAPGDRPARTVRRAIGARAALVVLDNHESDEATAAVLAELRGAPVTWVLTARRCLLGGVTVVPVTPPLIDRRRDLFPRVAGLTRLLRWNAVALDVADGLVASGREDVASLRRALLAGGVDRIRPMAHEDDVPEVRAVVRAALRSVGPVARRLLAVLASSRGDSIGVEALLAIGRAGVRGPEALDALAETRLVQQPAPGRLTLHATVRAAVERELPLDPGQVARWYLRHFEEEPRRVADDPTQLFALMDWAQETREVGAFVRVHALAEALLTAAPDTPSGSRRTPSPLAGY